MGDNESCTEFPSPIRNGSGASFDVHIYFNKDKEYEVKTMESLRQAIMEGFSELLMFKIWNEPIGPHPVPMFEVDIFTPAQFAAFVPWLAIHHGPLSVLIHPNTGNVRRDHTDNAIWMGKQFDLNLRAFEKAEQMDEVARRLEAVGSQ